MGSPFNWSSSEPGAADPLLFRPFFSDVARRQLPCQQAELFSAQGDSTDPLEAALPEDSRGVLALVRKKGKPVIDGQAPRLYLPLFVNDKPYAVAILEGGSRALYEKYTIGALLDRGLLIVAEYLALQARSGDPLTGLFSHVLWREHLLNRLADHEPFFVVLLENYPRVRDAAHAYAYLRRAAGALNSMAGREVPVFHLGGGVFAMVWEGVGGGQVGTMADVILYRLQRDGMARVHLGLAEVAPPERPAFAELMDRAWQGVVKARQRGSFARATCPTAAELARHPFRPQGAAELNRFRNLWRQEDKFCIAVLQGEHDAAAFGAMIRREIETGWQAVAGTGDAVYLFVAGLDREQAIAALRSLQDRVGARGGPGFSAGIAAFPYGNFKKASVPLNARKALQHNSFFGPGSITGFDAVSLNISGDLYYNDGDMNGAVREYLLGLEIDDANVNLLNSLGVAYVRLNRFRTAIGCFEKALAVEANNYMALFNLGSAWLAVGRDDLATGYLERALAADGRIFDLYLQLAELYCRSGEYGKVIGLLDGNGADLGNREEWETASALRCLGEAWLRLGENRRAMACLQKAAAFNPWDSKALSLLGEVYDAEKQGGDIALSLCLEAVALDEARWDNWHRLGLVRSRQGMRQEAVGDLQKSLRLNRANIEGARLLEEIYRKAGKKRLAAGMAEKVGKLEKSKKSKKN